MRIRSNTSMMQIWADCMNNPYIYFNIFDEFVIKVDPGKNRLFSKKIRNKYKAYLCDNYKDNSNIQLTITYSRQIPKNKNGFLFNNMCVGENYIESNYRSKLSQFKIKFIFENPDHAELFVNCNFLGLWPLVDLYIGSIVFFLLTIKGFCPIHASSAVKEEKLIITAGRRGVGKSTILNKLKKMGYEIISEDRVFIKNKKIYGLNTPVNLKFDRIDPNVKNIRFKYKLQLLLANVISKISLGRVNLMPNIIANTTNCSPHKITSGSKFYYLQSQNPFKVKTDVSLDSVASKVLNGNKFDLAFLNVELNSICFAYPNSIFANYWDEQEKLLNLELRQLEFIEVDIPTIPTSSQWDELLNNINT